ncbi:hypothetical protein [Sorangium sp. So ce363]|uniref:hypothetical protein n=1 Tax=Sorangium sp. So ce363 TaxID=3133304 RepID=UPI003F60A4C9
MDPPRPHDACSASAVLAAPARAGRSLDRSVIGRQGHVGAEASTAASPARPWAMGPRLAPSIYV